MQKSERAESSIDTEPRKLFEFICTVRVLAASLHCCVRSFLDWIAVSMHTMCSNDSDWLMSTNSLLIKAGCIYDDDKPACTPPSLITVLKRGVYYGDQISFTASCTEINSDVNATPKSPVGARQTDQVP